MADQLDKESSDPIYDEVTKPSKKEKDTTDDKGTMEDTGVGGEEGGAGDDPSGTPAGGAV